jgi:hypothetical protein
MGYLAEYREVGLRLPRVVELTDSERLERMRELVRILLTTPSPGLGPIRVEDWDEEPVWTGAQRSAYAELRAEVGLLPDAS